MRKPDFFIVGAPKCGTTAMNEYLKAHPEIFIPTEKEIHFFGSDLKFRRPRPTVQRYLSYFANARFEKRAGEASVWYLYSRKAAEEIKAFNPTAKILIMLRNPVDLLYSLHSQFLFTGNEDITDFKTALDAEEDRKKDLRAPKNAPFVQGLYYCETVKFTEQIKRYLNVFGKENVLIIIFDDFKEKTLKTYRETLEFLGVDSNFKTEFRVVNPNKVVRKGFLANFLKNSPQFFRGLAKGLIPQRFYTDITKLFKNYYTLYETRPPLDPDMKRKLQAKFAGEIEQLSLLIGRDLTHWTRY